MITLNPILASLNATALSSVPGCSKVTLRGRNAAISNAAETVWSPGATFARLTTGTALEAVSSSANDTAAGTGARTIVVEGLDGSFLPVIETVTLAGATPVALANTSLIAVNRVRIATAGSGLTNAGTIDVRVIAGGVIKRQISVGTTLGLGQDADFIFTVPAGYVALLGDVHFSASTVTGDLTVYLNSWDSTGVLKNEGAGKISLDNTGFTHAQGKIHFGSGLYLPAKQSIELRCIVTAGVGDLVAMAELFLFASGSVAQLSSRVP